MKNYLILFLAFNTLLWGQKHPYFKAPEGQTLVSADLHIHTVFSDGSVWPDIRVQEALREGIDLISLTEHLEYQPHSHDIPHPNRNRAFEVAQQSLGNHDSLLIVNGSEITRSMPPGHVNAVFIKDANLLLHKDSLSGIVEANRQHAFVFWNHPNWDAQRADGIARLEPFHQYLINQKLLHGIEVVNEHTFSEEAMQLAIDNGLTMIGTSDIHGLTTWEHDLSKDGHRPMTFVLADSRTPEAVKKNLFEGHTFIWFEDLIIGPEAVLNQVLKANIEIRNADYPNGKQILNFEIINHSAWPIHLKYSGAYSFHKQGDVLYLKPYQRLSVQLKTLHQRPKTDVSFEVLNAIVAPKKHPQIQFRIAWSENKP